MANKRSIALGVLLAVRPAVVQEDVEMVAGDFNGASWRRKSRPDEQFDSILEETPKNARLSVPPGTSVLWCAGGIPNELD